MRRIDAQFFQMRGEEANFFQRAVHIAVRRMPLDLDIELGHGEAHIGDIAFQLHHIDAVGGETAQRLVKRSGHAADLEQQAGDRLIRR